MADDSLGAAYDSVPDDVGRDHLLVHPHLIVQRAALVGLLPVTATTTLIVISRYTTEDYAEETKWKETTSIKVGDDGKGCLRLDVNHAFMRGFHQGPLAKGERPPYSVASVELVVVDGRSRALLEVFPNLKQVLPATGFVANMTLASEMLDYAHENYPNAKVMEIRMFGVSRWRTALKHATMDVMEEASTMAFTFTPTSGV